jgi:hypothetical protein
VCLLPACLRSEWGFTKANEVFAGRWVVMSADYMHLTGRPWVLQR